ncbi:MAG: hypothetical protein AB1798_08385 [Spirochaetota bacterium]
MEAGFCLSRMRNAGERTSLPAWIYGANVAQVKKDSIMIKRILNFMILISIIVSCKSVPYLHYQSEASTKRILEKKESKLEWINYNQTDSNAYAVLIGKDFISESKENYILFAPQKDSVLSGVANWDKSDKWETIQFPLGVYFNPNEANLFIKELKRLINNWPNKHNESQSYFSYFTNIMSQATLQLYTQKISDDDGFKAYILFKGFSTRKIFASQSKESKVVSKISENEEKIMDKQIIIIIQKKESLEFLVTFFETALSKLSSL